MDISEHLVLMYLTKDGHVFVCPQYSIRIGGGAEWSCPDFVALDFHRRAVLVVEVSAADAPKRLLEKVLARENQWVSRLKDQLELNQVVGDGWDYRTYVFIRANVEPWFRKSLGSCADVTVTTLESIGLPWSWSRTYGPSLPDGPLRDRT